LIPSSRDHVGCVALEVGRRPSIETDVEGTYGDDVPLANGYVLDPTAKTVVPEPRVGPDLALSAGPPRSIPPGRNGMSGADGIGPTVPGSPSWAAPDGRHIRRTRPVIQRHAVRFPGPVTTGRAPRPGLLADHDDDKDQMDAVRRAALAIDWSSSPTLNTATPWTDNAVPRLVAHASLICASPQVRG
jgi:hypothetical protein